MSSGSRSFLSTPLLATAVLVGVLSALLGLIGQVLRISNVSSWGLLLQVAFSGGLLSGLMGLAWAVRVLWNDASGGDTETESA